MTNQFDRLASALAHRYSIEREVGHGGMATVYLAKDERHHRHVAVKVLKPELATAVGPDRFLREIEIAAQLQHPHILPVYDSGEADGFLYYVMPYIEGESLRDRLTAAHRLPVEEALAVFRDVIDALAKAHKSGVVHRDIKPDNILLSDRHATVADFGIAKAVSDASGSGAFTTSGITLGTPGYMAPEQVAASPSIDSRADIYAMGIVMYEVLTGELPFKASTAQQLLAAHVTTPPEPITNRCPELPASVAQLVMRCLAKEPDERWQSAEDLLEAVDAIQRAAPHSTSKHRFRLPHLWLAAPALAVLIIAGWWAATRADSASTPTSPGTIAVMPFTVAADNQIEYLSDGMVNLLSTSLDGAGGLRSVNAHSLLGYVADQGGVDPGQASRIAERFGAGLYVLGDIVQAGSRLRITASMFDRGAPNSPPFRATVEGEAEAVFELVDQLAARLATERVADIGGRVTRIAALTTSSLPAIKSYLEGERAFRAGQYGDAAIAYQAAVSEDSTFAMAFYRLSMVQERLAWAEASQQSAEAAYRHSQRLAARHRQFFEAVLALRRGESSKAEEMFRGIVSTYPDDAEAWYQLGELMFHGNPLRGGSMTAGREPLTNALFYDPGDLGALYHLARIAVADGDSIALDTLTARFVELSPTGERSPELRALEAYAMGDMTTAQRVVDELRSSADTYIPIALWSVATFAHAIEGAADIARVMTSAIRPRDVQARGHLYLGLLEMARGRRRVARVELEEALQLGDPEAEETIAWLDVLPIAPSTPDDLRAARARLARWTGAATATSPRPSAFFSGHNGVHVSIREYLLGVLSARLGDVDAAGQRANRLEQETGDTGPAALARQLGQGLKAQILVAERHDEGALTVLDSLAIESWYELTFVSPFYAGALERFTRAELLMASGRPNEALGWYAGLGENTVAELVFLGPTFLRRAAILDAQGRVGEATELRAQFDRLWRDAEPDLRTWVETRFGR
jgi:serine/threonine protein kinase/tetratricopeptide (TPR) repeat protein